MSMDSTEDPTFAGAETPTRRAAAGNRPAMRVRDRRAGRATTIVLAGVALVSLGGLAFGVSHVMSNGTSPDTSGTAGILAARAAGAPPTRTGSDAAPAHPGPAARAPSAGSPRTSARRDESRLRDRKRAASDRPGSRPEQLVSRLEAKKAERRASTGEGRSFRRLESGSKGSGGASGSAPAAPLGFATPLEGAEAPPASTGESGLAYAPGFVEVLGVPTQTPGQLAGMQRGDRILEYNGRAVNGRLALEVAWADPTLPEVVPILVQTRGGSVETRDVPRGNLELMLTPRYNP